MIQVILLDKIDNLGDIGEVVDVKSGYARNFLIPNLKAKFATKENIALVEAHRVDLGDKLTKLRSEAKDRISEIKNLGVITISARSGVEGKLFGSIGSRDVADAVTKSGVKILKKHVRLPRGNIRSIGDYDVVIQMFHGISTVLRVSVVTSK